MSTNIGIQTKNSKAIAAILSRLLADEFVLYTKTRNAHWNIEGPDFYDKHKLFESLYEESDDYIDDIAERVRSIGHYTPATLKSFIELTHLTETSRSKNDSKGFIKELVNDHESIIIYLRENINKIGNDLGDLGTADFITGLMEKHEKTAWFLRSHLV